MGILEINDNAIWIKHIRNDEALKASLDKLSQNQTVLLEIAGVTGEWAKMRDDPSGRRTHGIRPEGNMAKVWKEMQTRRGETVEIRALRHADEYIGAVHNTLDEWSSPKDDEAYRDL